jgi:hypothetical protein
MMTMFKRRVFPVNDACWIKARMKPMVAVAQMR